MAKKDQVVEVESTKEDVVKRTEPNTYTYVGGGEDSPRVINFMGRQKFVRGQVTKVTDPEVLAKVKNNPTFIEGAVDEEDLHDYDQKAKEEADAQRKEDRKIQSAVDKAARKWAGKGEE